MNIGNVELQKLSANVQHARVWDMSVLTYSTSKRIDRIENCFAFQFTNVGDTVAYVNGMVIYPSATPGSAIGDSRSLSGHLLDLYGGQITLAIAPGGAAPLIEIVQLYYANQTVKN